MLINEWEIWQTFSSYFVDPIDDLEKVAKNLVQSGLLECAFIDNGDYYWLNSANLQTGHAEITLGANRSEAWVDIKSATPDGYAGEMILDSAYFRFIELQQFTRAKNFPPRYIRGYLGECILTSKDYTYNIYPMIKLYSTGIILIEMRILAPKGGISLERFIEEYINLGARSFDNALIPPGLRVAAQHAFALSERPKPSPLITRLGSYLLDRQIENNIRQNKITNKSGDFEFEYMYLWDLDIIEKEKLDGSRNKDTNFNVYTIFDLAKDIFHAVSITVPGLRRGKSLLLKPNRPLAVGSFWAGRPHTHLLKFQGQDATAEKNDSKFQNQFGWIMGGIYKRNSNLGKQYLPQNIRTFNDYGAYIAEQGTLWVWNKKGISSRVYKNIPKHVGLVYPNQSFCEVLEYGYILHRRMLELVSNLKDFNVTLKAREDLVDLETAMSDVSGYGEIRELLFQGWNAMQVDKLKTAISDLIAIRQTEATVKEGRIISAWQIILALVFGIAAIPTFADGVVKPLWNWINLWRPKNNDATEIMFFIIALIIFEIPILLFINPIIKKYRK